MNVNYKKIKSPHGFYSASPLPTLEELQQHYSSQYYEAPKTSTYKINYTDDEIKQKCLRADLNIYAISQVIGNTSGKTLFEIGCGEGFILNSGLNSGFVVTGVDFTNSGLKALNPSLLPNVQIMDAYVLIDEYIEQKKTFDVCVMQNVLEHVIDPTLIINKIRKILNPNGVILLNVPNDFSDLQMKALEEGLIDREFWFGPVEHLHYFNTTNLPNFIKSQGFSIRDTFGDFPIDLYLMHPDSNYIIDKSKGRSAHKARIMLDLLMAEKGLEAYHKFCQAMSGVGIGRNICLIAQKSENEI